MNAAERIALVERLARAIAWRALSDDERAARRRDAEGLVAELETAYMQLSDRLGWIFVDRPSDDDAGPEA